LRLWKKYVETDTGREPRTTPGARVEIKRLKKQIAELKKANEILQSASLFCATDLGQTSPK
jgi:transposase